MGCGVRLSVKLSDGRDVESLGAVDDDVRSTFRYPRPLLSIFVTECVQTFQGGSNLFIVVVWRLKI